MELWPVPSRQLSQISWSHIEEWSLLTNDMHETISLLARLTITNVTCSVSTLISLTRTSGRRVFFRSRSYFNTCLWNITSSCYEMRMDTSTDSMKKALREAQTMCAGCNNVEPKNFARHRLPSRAWDGQKLISWRWSLPLPTNPVWWGSMHTISSYCGNRRTHTHTHTPTHPATNRQDPLQYTAPQLVRSVISGISDRISDWQQLNFLLTTTSSYQAYISYTTITTRSNSESTNLHQDSCNHSPNVTWFRSPPKSNQLLPVAHHIPPKNFIKIRHKLFELSC